jgi:hypothetical protein
LRNLAEIQPSILLLIALSLSVYVCHQTTFLSANFVISGTNKTKSVENNGFETWEIFLKKTECRSVGCNQSPHRSFYGRFTAGEFKHIGKFHHNGR